MKGRKIHPIGEGHSEEYRPLVIFTDFRLHCIWFCVSIIKEIRRRQWHPTPALLPGRSHGWRSLVAAVHGVAKSRTRLSNFTFTFYFHALEKEMATHSSVLAWRIPGTGEPGGLPSMGLHRVGHDWSNLAAAAAAYCIDVFLSGFFKKKTLKIIKLDLIMYYWGC